MSLTASERLGSRTSVDYGLPRSSRFKQMHPFTLVPLTTCCPGRRSIFQADLNVPSLRILSSPTVIPMGIVSAGNADGAYNTQTSTYTAPQSGYFKFSWCLITSTVDAQGGGLITSALQVNGSPVAVIDATVPSGTETRTDTGTCMVQLKAGDAVNVTAVVSGTDPVYMNGPSSVSTPPFRTGFNGYARFNK